MLGSRLIASNLIYGFTALEGLLLLLGCFIWLTGQMKPRMLTGAISLISCECSDDRLILFFSLALRFGPFNGLLCHDSSLIVDDVIVGTMVVWPGGLLCPHMSARVALISVILFHLSNWKAMGRLL